MSAFVQRSHEERTRLEEAAAWRLRLRDEPGWERSPAFLEWVSEETNARALAAVDTASLAVAELSAAPEILRLRSDALIRARRVGARQWFSWRNTRRAAAVGAVFTLLASAALLYLSQVSTKYSTAVSERREIVLTDGSSIALDSKTEMSVRYSKEEREIELDRGRAHFQVAHDARRPFTVTAGNNMVIVLGTSFDVEKIGPKVWVTLIEGQVVVRGTAERNLQRSAVSLAPGQQLAASENTTTPMVTSADSQVLGAWEKGQLVFRNETLSDAVTRVNRYSHRLVIVDPSIEALRISGVFNAGDVGAFVSAVTSYFPVRATTSAKNDIVLQKSH